MALEHAILISLPEQPGSGYELTPALRAVDRPVLDRDPPADPPGAQAGADGPGERLRHVVLRGGIAYEKMVLTWLDDVLATLRGL